MYSCGMTAENKKTSSVWKPQANTLHPWTIKRVSTSLLNKWTEALWTA